MACGPNGFASRGRLSDFLAADRQRGFEGALLRFALFELHGAALDNLYVFVRTENHVILDGWSTNLLLEEAMTFRGGGTSPPAARFGDFARHVAASRVARGDELERFWKQQLNGWSAGVSSVLKEPTVSIEHMDFEQLRVVLPWHGVNMKAALKHFSWSVSCKAQGVTSAALLHAVWAMVLVGAPSCFWSEVP